MSIVFTGDFNPVIIQPFWLASKKFIREQEAESAKIEIIHPELVRFNLDWAQIEVTKQRFEIKTSQEPYFNPIKDLAISIFGTLRETPIHALGINHILHYALPDATKYYEFGNKLTPLSMWNGLLKKPTLLQLEIMDNERTDQRQGYFRIRIEPSDKIKQFGVAININDHFNVGGERGGRKGEMVKTLSEVWTSSNDSAIAISGQIWKSVNI